MRYKMTAWATATEAGTEISCEMVVPSVRNSKEICIGWSKIEVERESAALNGDGDQRWAATGAAEATTGCTSSMATETNSSAGARSGVLTHCFTAP